MAITQDYQPRSVWADEFLDELEDLRQDFLQGGLLRPRVKFSSKEDAKNALRRAHVGVNGGNHKFVGEKYLNATDQTLRRRQLRKLVDEGGQTTVTPSGLPSHPTLAKWTSLEFGITEEEIADLERQDMNPELLLSRGWQTASHRVYHWSVSTGCSLVGEGEPYIPKYQEMRQQQIREMRKEFQAWKIKDLDRALANAIEHAGVDIEHATISADAVRLFCDTPELKDEMREAYVLTLHFSTGKWRSDGVLQIKDEIEGEPD